MHHEVFIKYSFHDFIIQWLNILMEVLQRKCIWGKTEWKEHYVQTRLRKEKKIMWFFSFFLLTIMNAMHITNHVHLYIHIFAWFFSYFIPFFLLLCVFWRRILKKTPGKQQQLILYLWAFLCFPIYKSDITSFAV